MGSRERIALRMKRTLRHMRPGHMVTARVTKQTIERFADKVGLVYFGSVDQRDEEHRLIRGHTVSATHLDKNYCIGTVRGYDVMLVLRNDVVCIGLTRDEKRCHLLIMTVDLHTKNYLPRFYVGHKERDAEFAASHSGLYPIAIGASHGYSARFLNEYTVYSTAARTLDIERAITPEMAEVMAAHFAHASIEVDEGTLYLYIESERPDEALLEKLLSNVLWLAESIDNNLDSQKAVD